MMLPSDALIGQEQVTDDPEAQLVLARKLREVRGLLALATLALARYDGMGLSDDDLPVSRRHKRAHLECACGEIQSAGAQALEIMDLLWEDDEISRGREV